MALNNTIGQNIELIDQHLKINSDIEKHIDRLDISTKPLSNKNNNELENTTTNLYIIENINKTRTFVPSIVTLCGINAIFLLSSVYGLWNSYPSAMGIIISNSLSIKQIVDNYKAFKTTELLNQFKKKNQILSTRNSRLVNVLQLNEDIQLHTKAKIISIAGLTLGLIAIISNIVIVALPALSVGLASAIITKNISKRIQNYFDKISDQQKKNNFENNYELTASNFFYNKIKSPTNNTPNQVAMQSS